MFQLTRSVTWQALKGLQQQTATDRIRDYFAADPMRFEKMSLRVGGLFLDYSKQPVSEAVRSGEEKAGRPRRKTRKGSSGH